MSEVEESKLRVEEVVEKVQRSEEVRVDEDEVEKELAKEIETSKQIEKRIKQAIEVLGNANKYQIILIAYLILCFVFASFLLIGTSYFYMNPNFTCYGQSTTELQACTHLADCTLQNDYTITGYIKLYCGDRKVAREVAQAMLGVGACLGVLFINFVSDYKGRKFSFVFSLATGIFSVIIMIIGAFTNTPHLFILSQILAGFCGNSILTLVYVMSDRLMSKKYSNICILITNAFFAVAQASIILFTGILNWQHLSIFVMLIPSCGLIALCYFVIIQDPIFLFTKGNYKDCKKNLEIIAVYNDTCGKLNQCYGIVDQMEKEHVGLGLGDGGLGWREKLKYFRLLKKKEVFVPMMLIGLFNFGGNLNYYILNYAISNTGASFELDIGLFGAVEFIGIIPMSRIYNNLVIIGESTPRKSGMMLIVVAHIIVSAFFLLNLSSLIQTVIIVFIRFIFTSLYMLYIFFVVETFPQHIQATCFGIVEFISQLGKFFAPFMITLADSLTISPLLLTAVISIIFGVPTLLPLKETLKRKKVSDNVQESLLEPSQQ